MNIKTVAFNLMRFIKCKNKPPALKRRISKATERKIVAVIGSNNNHFANRRYLTEADIDQMRHNAFKT